jgi:DNA modification methylase
MLRSSKFEIRNQIVWSKPNLVIGRGHYHWQHEPCWYAVKDGATAHWIGDHSQSTVWQIGFDEAAEGGHSAQKPVECMARAIRNHDGDVYDPFVGSGTTVVAAENLGRICYAIDIAPQYVAVTLQRLATMGLDPVLVETREFA